MTSSTCRRRQRFVGAGESPFQIVPGEHLMVTGIVAANTPAFAATGLSAGDLSSVTAQGAHIEVALHTALRIS